MAFCACKGGRARAIRNEMDPEFPANVDSAPHSRDVSPGDMKPIASRTYLTKEEVDHDADANHRALMFRNRLRKNLRRIEPWAAQRRLEAYRLYDSDIPEIRLIVERYGPNLVVWEYARRDEHEQSQAGTQDRFLDAVLNALVEECKVPREHIYVKRRRRQRTFYAGQYEPAEFMNQGRTPSPSREVIVTEGGHRFIVNLSDYLDTGLFLDHRETRALIGRLAPGKRVLNLFGYTGSFTVYAARGGAPSSVTVDMSSTYLDWAARNFTENGLDLTRHRLVRADVLSFLRTPPKKDTTPPFDLIVLDPPTFSNSKRMQGTLDVLRDHAWLIHASLRLLSKKADSVLLFSTNQRRFILRQDELPHDLHIEDLSAKTLPRDFHDPRTRTCYLIRHPAIGAAEQK